MRNGIRAFLSILLLAATVQTQDKKLKVYISADMEGVGGVSTWQVQAAPGAPEYEKFRRLMTLEVNSAISGAFEAGANEVLVSDSHWNAQNIDIEILDHRARLVRAFPRPLAMMQGIDDTFECCRRPEGYETLSPHPSGEARGDIQEYCGCGAGVLPAWS